MVSLRTAIVTTMAGLLYLSCDPEFARAATVRAGNSSLYPNLHYLHSACIQLHPNRLLHARCALSRNERTR